jgi:hypothetical protein
LQPLSRLYFKKEGRGILINDRNYLVNRAG